MIVGIDVSKDKLDITLSEAEQHFCIKNKKASIVGFIKNKLPKSHLSLVVFEPTGGYEKPLQLILSHLELPFHKAHPNRVRHFALAKGYFAKTDKIDSRVLCRYGEQKEIQPDEETDEKQLKMRELAARRHQLKANILSETHRLKQTYVEKQIKLSIKRHLKYLQRELAQITKTLKELISQNEILKQRQELMCTLKGVGEEISLTLLTELPELGQVSREEISALVGVAPQTKDSGKKQGHRSIRRGRFMVRKALYMSALVGIRHNPRMKSFYEHLLNKGKLKKVALVAVMRKMIMILNSMVKNNSPWQPERI